MANNVILRKIDLTEQWQKLSTVPLVGSVTISTAPANAAAVLMRSSEGIEVPWVAGEWHEFKRIDLSQIEVKGTAGDVVTVVGGTW